MQYNIRVYGLWISERSVLISDEIEKGFSMTKFPGGGHVPGESLPDCLKRECMEEMNIEIQVLNHFYTTDTFIKSSFNPNHQLISVYYLFEPITYPGGLISELPFNFNDKLSGQSFRWLPISNHQPDIFTFPVDRHVFSLLKTQYA